MRLKDWSPRYLFRTHNCIIRGSETAIYKICDYIVISEQLWDRTYRVKQMVSMDGVKKK